MREGLKSLTAERFEEFCKELLCLDGFHNVAIHARGADGGTDITATKSYQVAHGQEHRVDWLVQCKHISNDRSLSADIVKEILYNFETQNDCQGLVIITNGKFSSSAVARIRELLRSRHRPVVHWDITDIEHFLQKHPFLIDKFSLDLPSQVLPGASRVRVLLMSDGSVFAYHIFDCLRRYGFDVRETRLHQLGANSLRVPASRLWKLFDLAFVFLGELYWLPIDPITIAGLRISIENGMRVVFTPFCAWSVGSGVNPTLGTLLPVSVRQHSVDPFKLLLQDAPVLETYLELPNYTDTFIENQLVSFKSTATNIIASDFPFNGRSTYEFLKIKSGANVLIVDADENPVVTVRPLGDGLVGYFNMCAHNCLTPFPLRSPFEQSEQMRRFFAQFCIWVRERDSEDSARPGWQGSRFPCDT